jgi:nanoRNase/pAp phosphatase (c-di-AMP/oligoRNAs hydrolase)
MLKYHGGGHEAAGTCQIDNEVCEDIFQELVKQITNDG